MNRAVQILTNNISTVAYIMHLGPLKYGNQLMGDMLQVEHRTVSPLPSRDRESTSGLSRLHTPAARVETTSRYLPHPGWDMGHAHGR